MDKETLIDKLYNRLAWRLPRPVVYHDDIRMWGGVTATKYTAKHPCDVNWDMATDAWTKGYGK